MKELFMAHFFLESAIWYEEKATQIETIRLELINLTGLPFTDFESK